MTDVVELPLDVVEVDEFLAGQSVVEPVTQIVIQLPKELEGGALLVDTGVVDNAVSWLLGEDL